MTKVKLTKGFETPVDDALFEELSKHNWMTFLNGEKTHPYAGRWAGRDGKRRLQISMARWILGKPPFPKAVADHINRDTLDNRRVNLRWITQAQNRLNAKPRKGNTTGLRGVRVDKRTGKFIANVTVQLGIFETREAAALAVQLWTSRRMKGEI